MMEWNARNLVFVKDRLTRGVITQINSTDNIIILYRISQNKLQFDIISPRRKDFCVALVSAALICLKN